MIEIGILKEWNSTDYTASVQIRASATYFDAIPVARNIASGDMVIGRHVVVAMATDPKDAVVIAVFTP